jgi:fatty-acyl-CoA synthase
MEFGWLAVDAVARQARVRPKKTAIVEVASGRAVSFAELDAEIARAAGFLAATLKEPGARVAVLARNSLAQVAVFFACARMGAAFQPLNWRLTGAELKVLIEDGRPGLLIYDAEFESAALEGMTAAPPAHVIRVAPGDDPLSKAIANAVPYVGEAFDPDQPVTLLYTSGTTGRPKGAIITRRSAFFGGFNFISVSDLTPNSVMLCETPLFHVVGLFAALQGSMAAGATLYLSDRFLPDETLDKLADRRLGITHYFCVPQMVQVLTELPKFAQADLSGLKMFSGGAPLPQALFDRLGPSGPLLVNGFGMTESLTTIGMPLDREAILSHMGACGVPAPTIEIRLVDHEGRDTPTGEAGEIWLRGPTVTPGYWRQPEATAKAFSADGWFRTGDAAYRDADGFYYVVDRWKDMYITGGENVYPAEVESCLLELAGVSDAAVIGVPDARWGESGCAWLVLAEGASVTQAQVLAHCDARLARYKRPAIVRFIDAIPRTASGKIRKDALRQRYAAEG